MEELGGEGREEGGGEGVGVPFNVLPQGATDVVAPLMLTVLCFVYCLNSCSVDSLSQVVFSARDVGLLAA